MSTETLTAAVGPHFHCLECRKTFTSVLGVTLHSKNAVCHDTEICHGLIDHPHQEVREEFLSMEEATEWLTDREIDTLLRIRTSTAKRKVFCCRQSMSSKIVSKNAPANRTLNQASRSTILPSTSSTSPSAPLCSSTCTSTTAMDVVGTRSQAAANCPAKLTFLRVTKCQCPEPITGVNCLFNSEVVRVTGCLFHSHPIEKRNLRLSKAIKEHASELLKAGLQPKVILKQYFPVNERDDESKPVTRSDLYRIQRGLHLDGYDPKVSEVVNVTKLMAEPQFCGFNYGQKFDMSFIPRDIQSKIVETRGLFLMCFASEEMIQRFQNHPTIISIDGTHGTCSSKYVLISILVFDERGEGCPVFQCLVENENQAIFSAALKVLKNLAPEACSKVKCLLSDTSHTFINSWREVINDQVQWSVCHWHLEKSWSRHIKEPEMLAEIKGLRLISKVEKFDEEWAKIKRK